MTAVDKTNQLQRKNLPVSVLEVNDKNPNEMSERQFNMLCDNIQSVGFVDPVFVREMPEGKYRVIGGAHRLEVAKMLGFEEVPCTIITDPEFDDDLEKFQIVRMNVIRGSMTPEKFMNLYNSLQGKYEEEIAQEMFGFVDEAEFRKLVKKVGEDLPSDMKAAFKEASTEIKTVDDLSKVLNSLFSRYGDSLPYGYMLIDFGGKESVWLRMENKTKAALYQMGDRCRASERTMDDLIGGLLRLAAEGKLEEHLSTLVASSKPVVIPEKFTGLPTAETLGV